MRRQRSPAPRGRQRGPVSAPVSGVPGMGLVAPRDMSQKPAEEITEFVNQTAAAEELGIRRETLWLWIKDDKAEAVIVGGLRMIRRTEVDRLKAERDKAAK